MYNLSSARTRLRDAGPAYLSIVELLCLITRSRSTETLEAMLHRYDRLSELAGASLTELERTCALTPASAAGLVAAFELTRRVSRERRARRSPVSGSADLRDRWLELGEEPVEVFGATLLDARHRPIRDVIISRGTLTSSLVHPREAFVTAIRERAAAIAFVHNHPSGDTTPSALDKELTERLVQVGTLVGIQVLDHLVIARGEYTSLADEGLIR